MVRFRGNVLTFRAPRVISRDKPSRFGRGEARRGGRGGGVVVEDETIATDDRRVRISYTPGLHVVVDQPGTLVRIGRRRVDVLYALEVSAAKVGGRLTITTRSRSDRLLTALVAVGARYEVLAESLRKGRERTFALEIPRGAMRRVVVVEHPAGLAPEELPGVLPRPEEFWRPEPVRRRPAERSRRTRAMPPPPGEVMQADREAEQPAPARAVLAEVGANMPSEVHLDDTVPVEVLLSRDEVPVFGVTVHDEQVIVMDPDRPLDVVLLRRGFDLDDRELPRETGRRSLFLPPEGEAAVRVVFWLRAAQEGEGEVQVVVRQDDPQPLATLRLTVTVLPRSEVPMDRASAEVAAQARTPTTAMHEVAGGVKPFADPPFPGHRREPRRGRLGAVLRPRPARLRGAVHPRRAKTRSRSSGRCSARSTAPGATSG